MLTILAYWLPEKSLNYIKKIDLIFPIVAHFFIPLNCTFGLTEKTTKENAFIVEITAYDDLRKTHSTIQKIGIDWNVHDRGIQIKQVIKLHNSWHFEFIKTN